MLRSNHPEMFCKIDVPKNFAEFTEKRLSKNFFLIRLQTFIRNKTLAQVVSCEFCGFFKNNFFYRTLFGSVCQIVRFQDCLLKCNNYPSLDEFTILVHGNKKYLLEIKGSPSIKRDQPVLNKSISPLTYIYSTRFNPIIWGFLCDNCNFYNLSQY